MNFRNGDWVCWIREREEKMRILTGENGFMVCGVRVRVWD